MPDSSDDHYLDLLKRGPTFRHEFTEREIEDLSRLMVIRSFQSDEVLSREGEPANSAMVVLRGMAHVVMGERRVAVLKEGDFFGESAFSDDARRKASVIARSDGVAAELTIEQFERLIREQPVVAWKYQRFFDGLRRKNAHLNERFFDRDATRYVALMAHNEKKAELIEFVRRHLSCFDRFPLVATGTTGTAIFETTGLTLSRKVASGPLGGDQVIGSMVASDNILAVIFFRDPLSAHAHHADVEALGRVCDVYRVPFATNTSTAEAVLRHLDEAVRNATPDAGLAAYRRHQSEVVEGLKDATSAGLDRAGGAAEGT